jgi:protein-L-isoaspartate(D-aspartate) O-methyltransferase
MPRVPTFAVLAALASLALSAACSRGNERQPAPAERGAGPEGEVGAGAGAGGAAWPRADERDRMVDQQIAARDVTDEQVLEAMRAVPRHELVPNNVRSRAYQDRPLPIGLDQTISQPYIVAKMTELARVGPGSRVLEIGTGSGYQAAVLAALGCEVYTIEIVEPLGRRAARDLERLGYQVHARIGDGYRGWPEAAPFDAVIVTAAPPRVPEPLLEQLAVGGRLVAPVGRRHQELRVITRTEAGFEEETAFPVRFVPMTGEAQGPGEDDN